MRACQPKDSKRREWRSAWGGERKRKSACTLERKRVRKHFYMFFPLPGPALCKLTYPGVLFVLPEVFTLVLGPSFVLFSWAFPFLVLATTILDSFSLFYLPNIPPSRDRKPNSLGIGASRSFWLLPAELGWRRVLGLPLLLVSSLRVLIAVFKGV